MIVQEAGVAVGWPLGLGQDTTGWPLGLRLRLTQEDLQWPREPHLTRSPSYTSEDSSSLDTMSTKSFFQDKSISLGTLIGLPILDYPANGRQQRRDNNNRAFPTTAASTSATSARSSSHEPSQPSRRSQQNGRASRRKNGASAAAHSHPTGWNLLSVLSCARVPSDISVSERGPPRQASGRAEQHDLDRSFVRSLHLSAHSLGSKLYDNITFEEEDEEEEEESEEPTTASDGQDGSHSSKEWNPLFVSSSSPQTALDDYDEEDHGHDEKSETSAATAPAQVLEDRLPATTTAQMVRSASARDSEYSQMMRKREEELKQVVRDEGRDNFRVSRDRHGSSDYRFKHKAVSMFVSRMVCCRSTPTRGSSY